MHQALTSPSPPLPTTSGTSPEEPGAPGPWTVSRVDLASGGASPEYGSITPAKVDASGAGPRRRVMTRGGQSSRVVSYDPAATHASAV